MTDSLATKLAQIRGQIPPDVRLIAVTKQVSVNAIRKAYEFGIRDFAESRLQEATEKQEQLLDLPDITWHFIGHLQKNKAAKVIQQFQWIHSVDCLSLLQKLNDLAHQFSLSPQILLQVKILPDPQKYGWTVTELLEDLSHINACEFLQIQGLMAIPPLEISPSETLSLFQQAYQLAQTIKEKNYSRIKMTELSMGMSGDYLLGIEAGATMIRLGSILFGERS